MNDCPQFSIIIPCYNAGQWIRRTIDSVLAQTCADFEIIAVDDGSKDDTLIQLQSINDPRVIILNKENGGVSSARNMGLRKANGRWVTFIDADDTVESYMLEELQKAITRSPESSLFIWGISKDFYLPDGRLVETETRLSSTNLCIPYHSLGWYMRYMLTSLDMESTCNKLFRRALVETHGIRFDEQAVVFEDFQFVIDYLSKCNPDISIIKSALYHYRANEGEPNVSRRSRYNLVGDIEILIIKLFDFVKDRQIPQEDMVLVYRYIMQKVCVILSALKGHKQSVCVEVFNDLRISRLKELRRFFPLVGRKYSVLLKLVMNRSFYPAWLLLKLI